MNVVLPGTYTFDITATVGSSSSTVTFTLTLIDPCFSDVTLTLLTSPFIDRTFDLGSPETSLQSWTEASLVSSDAWVDCGPIAFEFYLTDSSALNPLIFEDRRDVVSNDLVLLLTENYDHVGLYEITYRAYYQNYDINSVE